MKMSIKPKTLLRRLDNKVVSARELRRYFGTKSLDDLLLTLRRLTYDDYCTYEVILSAEYFEWQRAHRDVIFENDIVAPFDYAYKAMRERDTYGLSVKANQSLAEKEVVEIMQKLPPDLAEKHLRFKLTNIDQEKLYEFVMSQQKSGSTDKDEYYDRVEHNGLIVDGVEVTYNDEPVTTSFQHRQALRLLMRKKGKLCYKDEFTDAEAGIFNEPPKDHALRNLIYEVRKALRAVTRQDCIRNTPGEGWSLKI